MWRDGSATAVLASLLFDLPEPQHSGKTKCSTTFLPCRHRTDMDFRVLNAQTVPIWSPSQSLWAQLQRNMTYWRQLRPQGIATSARSTLKHACIPLFPTFFGFAGGSGPRCLFLACLGVTSAPDAPDRTNYKNASKAD